MHSTRTTHEYVNSPHAERMLTRMAYCKAYGMMGVISGGPGVGKSSAARQLATMLPYVWIVAANPMAATPNQVMRALAFVLGVTLTPSLHGHALFAAICERVRGKPALIIVDEAQHLKAAALETLRAVHDETGVGVVLMGDPDLYRIVTSRGPLSSRVFAACAQVAPPEASDVAAICKGWGIVEGDVVRLLERLALTTGALRIVRQVVELAARGGDVTLASVRTAVQTLGLEFDA